MSRANLILKEERVLELPLRAAGRTGWEDLVRKCIYAFFQPQGREPSYARQLFQEGKVFPLDYFH